ncbi:hypothetical protein NPIL_359091, partial [Nephila pilipes]
MKCRDSQLDSSSDKSTSDEEEPLISE